LQLEGLIDEDLDYDDWICQSNTWLQLGTLEYNNACCNNPSLIVFKTIRFICLHTGDKCAMHHMFVLATDFYGLGIMKDPDAFRKPMLWMRFAKACRRCGRISDGILAVKVCCE
jgi:hypothetical protein